MSSKFKKKRQRQRVLCQLGLAQSPDHIAARAGGSAPPLPGSGETETNLFVVIYLDD